MPEIHPVTKENWRELSKLQVAENQKDFVAPNVYSIAVAQFGIDDDIGHWSLYPFGVYDEGMPVGFFLYGLNYEHPETQGLIMRLMVDEKHQNRGYGRFAMQAMLEIFRADEKVKKIALSYEPENNLAQKFYARLGFVETGEIFEGELVAILKMRD